MDNILLNKSASLERGLKRIQETCVNNNSTLEEDHDV